MSVSHSIIAGSLTILAEISVISDVTNSSWSALPGMDRNEPVLRYCRLCRNSTWRCCYAQKLSFSML